MKGLGQVVQLDSYVFPAGGMGTADVSVAYPNSINTLAKFSSSAFARF